MYCGEVTSARQRRESRLFILPHIILLTYLLQNMGESRRKITQKDQNTFLADVCKCLRSYSTFTGNRRCLQLNVRDKTNSKPSLAWRDDFAVSGPTSWNSPPAELHSAHIIAAYGHICYESQDPSFQLLAPLRSLSITHYINYYYFY